MARGAVYFHPQFKFHDNEIGEKRFVILNEPRGDEPYLVAKTTTNLRDKAYVKGCHPAQRAFFVPAGSEEALPLDTLIQLFEFYEFSKAELLEASLRDKLLEHRGNLTVLTIAQLVNCIKKLKYDIPQQYFELITRQ
jgi:hypothetical protein